MQPPDASRAASPRVVLDTNVCLDLFVFADPRCARLEWALRAGAIEAVGSAQCEAEWRAVLDYPQLALEPAVRTRALEAYLERVRPRPHAVSALPMRLPRCADADDQKFLELAACAGARWLLSRDRALLTLHRRCLRVGGFAVITPQAWPGPDEPPRGDTTAQGVSANPV